MTLGHGYYRPRSDVSRDGWDWLAYRGIPVGTGCYVSRHLLVNMHRGVWQDLHGPLRWVIR